MTIEEYKKREEEFADEYTRKMQALKREFAFANCPYKKGDIVSDGEVTIRVERMGVYYPLAEPPAYIVMCGPRLKKNGEQFKSGEYANVFQSNIKK